VQALTHACIAVIIGVCIAALMLGGLRLTLTQLRRARYPVLLVLASMIARLALAATIFLVVMLHLGALALALCAGSFVLTRWLFMSLHTDTARAAEGR